MERPNIILTDTCSVESYASPSHIHDERMPYPRDRARHAELLKKELADALHGERLKRDAGEISRDGTYLSFQGPVDGSLEFARLENLRAGVRLLNVKQQGNVTSATVYVPSKKIDYYSNKVDMYADPNHDSKKTGKPANNDLVASIESVSLGTLDSFWTGRPERIPGDGKIWVEAWLRYGDASPDKVKTAFIDLLDSLDIDYSSDSVSFPERIVMLIHANAEDLNTIIDRSSYLAELCEALEVSAFLDNAAPGVQGDWINDLLGRTTFTADQSVICVLDTGVNSAHPLLRNMIGPNALMRANPSWDLIDHMGHGTMVAGLSLYGDLAGKLDSCNQVEVTHRLESVKMYEPNSPTPQEFYAAITKESFYRAISTNNERNRVFCSAVTAAPGEINDGTPNSWSAAVDYAVSHPDDESEDHELFLVSAGNVETNWLNESGYPDANRIRSVRSPGQAWNALTVGAYSENAYISDGFNRNGYTPVAQHNELSPFSTTSRSWLKTSPVKPEVLFSGGNAVTDGHTIFASQDLSPLSTGAEIARRPIQSFYGTSAAVSEAAWMAAELENAYPDLWPETIRGLIVHSARWPQAMLNQFCPPGSSLDKPTTGRRDLLRMCGYGIPSLERARECASNRVNLIVQGELTPFACVVEGGIKKYRMKDMHLHHLPWPEDLLQKFGDTKAVLRVTLSYYIEPCPGNRGWTNRYRYASHGLRFDVNSPSETKDEFARRINRAMRDEGEGRGQRNSRGWFLGTSNRTAGSVFSDFKETTALELSDIEYVAVYPIIGWWRELHSQDKVNSKARYSLIVSIETPGLDIDLYTSIKNKIKISAPIPITAAHMYKDKSNSKQAE